MTEGGSPPSSGVVGQLLPARAESARTLLPKLRLAACLPSSRCKNDMGVAHRLAQLRRRSTCAPRGEHVRASRHCEAHTSLTVYDFFLYLDCWTRLVESVSFSYELCCWFVRFAKLAQRMAACVPVPPSLAFYRSLLIPMCHFVRAAFCTGDPVFQDAASLAQCHVECRCAITVFTIAYWAEHIQMVRSWPPR
jgi:hypothetical protein